MSLSQNAPHVEVSLASAGLRPIARVLDSRHVLDFAFPARHEKFIVLRLVTRAEPSDYRALKTMLTEGDFDRAVLVYCDPEQPFLSEEIESWAIGDVDKLAASLAGEGAGS